MTVTIPVWELNALQVVEIIFGYIFVTAICYSIARKIEGGLTADLDDATSFIFWPVLLPVFLLAASVEWISNLIYKGKQEENLLCYSTIF